MQVNAGKLQLLTVAAMLVLISGGIAVYAQNQFAVNAGAPGAPGAADNGNRSGSSMFTSSDTTTTFSTSSSSTTLTSTTTTENHTLCQPPSTDHVGRLVMPITATGSTGSATGAMTFSDGRGCLATITTVGGVFNVGIVLRFGKPLTQYQAVLVANGTSYTLGNMVTGQEGSGQMQNQVLLKPGTYVVSIKIFDTSSNPGQSTLVMQTGQGTIVSPPFPSATSSPQPPMQGGQGDQGDQGQSGQHR